MTDLTHRVTGHQIKVSDESVGFWGAAGYVAPQPPARKAPAKKAAPKKSSSTK